MSRFTFDLPLILTGTNNGETLVGTDGNDLIYGYNGDDTINGGHGHDIIYGGDQNDTLHGGWGNDNLIGGTGDDKLYGEWGDDTLDGGYGNDTMHGGNGNNLFIPGLGNDKMHGGDDHDTVDYSALSQGVNVTMHQQLTGTGTVTGTGGLVKNDTLTSIEKVIGGQGNDTMILGARTEAAGGAGDDTFKSGTGANVINGGGGFDTVSYMGRDDGITVDLARKTASDGDTLIEIENVIGTAHGDLITGNAAANELFGGDGRDYLKGGAGNDRLIGGRGGDSLEGGSGADRFVFVETADSEARFWYDEELAQRDSIVDFNRAEGDKIELKGMGAFFFSGDLQGRSSYGNSINLAPREIGFTQSGGGVRVWVNVDGDAKAEMQFYVKGVDDLQASDFVFA